MPNASELIQRARRNVSSPPSVSHPAAVFSPVGPMESRVRFLPPRTNALSEIMRRHDRAVASAALREERRFVHIRPRPHIS